MMDDQEQVIWQRMRRIQDTPEFLCQQTVRMCGNPMGCSDRVIEQWKDPNFQLRSHSQCPHHKRNGSRVSNQSNETKQYHDVNLTRKRRVWEIRNMEFKEITAPSVSCIVDRFSRSRKNPVVIRLNFATI
ncbi:hypothetical protein M8C21_017694 [Ambrosia artemisiifolia]|uniref:Uncharacterized protein n=1 Tax=Ambrosia artemisiifolia TaxID=4212 RepID=A0AAD5GMC4_AMBAR|nr:hypothetical protein M8C21_017694 [Ambrosia artemisiifolia]